MKARERPDVNLLWGKRASEGTINESCWISRKRRRVRSRDKESDGEVGMD